MGRTKKPCPGCGKVDPNRPAASVCATCRRKIDGYADLIRRDKERRDALALVVFRMGEAIHWNPRFYPQMGPADNYDVGRVERDELGTAFWELVRTVGDTGLSQRRARVSNSVQHIVENQRPGYHYSGEIEVSMTQTERDALDRLFRAIHLSLASAYDSGLDRGRRFVTGMIDGTYDPQDLQNNG